MITRIERAMARPAPRNTQVWCRVIYFGNRFSAAPCVTKNNKHPRGFDEYGFR